MAAGGVIQGAMSGASAGASFGPWGAAIGGVLGGIAGNQDGGNNAAEAAHAMFDRQYQVQKEFAQNGIRWRVEDAIRAGVHPLFALGSQPFNPNFSFVGDLSRDSSSGAELAGSLAEHGQNLARAIDSTRTQGERDVARVDALRLENMQLQNDLLRSQIAKNNLQSFPPSPGSDYLIPGQAQTPVVTKPLERVGGDSVQSHQEPGAITSLGWENTGTGLRPVPSKDVKERIEDMNVQELLWSLRNNLLPNVDFSSGRSALKPPHRALPAGATHWRWNYLRQEWQAHYPSSSEDVRGRVFRLPD